VCDVKDPAGSSRLLTSASSFGRLYTETNLTYDRRARDIVRGSVEGSNVQVSRDVTPDPAQTSLIELYKELVRPIASEVVGSVTQDVTREQSPAGESQLGDLIADAQLADPTVVTGGQEPVIAFMNPGGIRTDLDYESSKYGEAPGDITYEEAFAVQPFNNYLVSMTLTGQQIYDLLTEQVTGANAASRKVLQVSEGFSYQLGPNGPVDGTVELEGEPIDKGASYRIVTNNFLADGGDGFPTFRDGQAKYFGGLDIEAFAAYLEDSSPYTPGVLDRITQ
jgi:5'-nucleotidase